MPVDNPEMIVRYLSLAKQYKIAIDGTCVDKLHDNGLKSDPLAQKWVLDSIRLTKALDTKVLLLPFFGRWALQTKEEMDHTGDVLRELAPEATKAGMILGLEDTISAEDNVRIMERSRSASVMVYYDVGNSTQAGFDPVKEIRWLEKTGFANSISRIIRTISVKERFSLRPSYERFGISDIPVMRTWRPMRLQGS